MTGPAAPARVKQPNSRHCFVCGIENRDGFGLAFYETAPDRVDADVVIPVKFEGYPGIAHGGIVAALLDEITLRAAMVGRPNTFLVTGRMVIRYRKPVRVGEPVHLQGIVWRRRARAIEARGRLMVAGDVAVEGEATLFESPKVGFATERLADLGWKVYPD